MRGQRAAFGCRIEALPRIGTEGWWMVSESTLAYEISVNGEAPITCGASELDVLSAMLTAVKERGGADLSVAGLVVKPDGEHEHWRWLSKPLGVGDQITVRIVADRECAPPVSKETIDPNQPPPTE